MYKRKLYASVEEAFGVARPLQAKEEQRPGLHPEIPYENKNLKKCKKLLMKTGKRPILNNVKGNKIPVNGVQLRAQRNTSAETGKFQ